MTRFRSYESNIPGLIQGLDAQCGNASDPSIHSFMTPHALIVLYPEIF